MNRLTRAVTTARRLGRGMSLRVRLIVLGLAGLAAGLGIGAVALVLALSFALQRTVDDEATGTAREVAALVDAAALPDPVPVAGAHIVQVIDTQHRVRGASRTGDRLVPMLREADLAGARRGEKLFVPGDSIGVSGVVRVVAIEAGPAADRQTVVVARPIGELRRSVGLLRTLLLVLYPLLLFALGALAWRIVGAALRPVEALRAGAERITGSATTERLPVPPSHDEIHRLAVTLNGMLDRLAGARARQRAFVGDAAHELRSPLASMRTQLEVAQLLGERGQPAAELIGDLLVDVERLSRLVNDLLLLARLDEQATASASQPVRDAEPVELGALLRDAARRRHGGRVPVRVVDCPPLWTVGQPDGLRRVLDNLVDNAVRHAGSAVVLSATPLGPYHRVTVTDDGPGIPAVDRQRVFERFTRLDDGRASDAGGAGLGLAIVRELVRRHGGTVELADAGAGGTRVEVRLPALQPEA